MRAWARLICGPTGLTADGGRAEWASGPFILIANWIERIKGGLGAELDTELANHQVLDDRQRGNLRPT